MYFILLLTVLSCLFYTFEKANLKVLKTVIKTEMQLNVHDYQRFLFFEVLMEEDINTPGKLHWSSHGLFSVYLFRQI